VSEATPGEIDLGARRLALPAFLPDATRGVVRCLDAADLASTGIRALCVNAFHLSRAPGIDALERLGGIHDFAGIDLPVFSDSGGFQVLSLEAQRDWSVSVSGKGIRFSKKGEREDKLLSPEKSVQHQCRIGADAIVALDHCSHPAAPRAEHERSVAHTLEWARRAIVEYRRYRDQSGRAPRLFGVIQGGPFEDLRRRCAESLLELGYDAFGFGGWPIGDDGDLVPAVLEVAELVPRGAPLWGLGIGRPDSLATCVAAGYSIFDCTLPTRDARRGRAFRRGGARGFEYVYVDDEKHRRSTDPIDPECEGACCRGPTLGFLRHLRDVEEPLADRLLTIHNLRFYARFIDALRRTSAP
jgi:queuine tRNA-ribosyltransferase